jgi:hypothetical protein
MKFFDYLYYRIFHLYRNKWNEEEPKLYAVGLVSLMQEFNLGGLLFFLIFLFNVEIEKIYVILFYIIIFVFNWLWYSRIRKFEHLASGWDDEITIKRMYKGILLVLYIIVSTILFFYIAVILGRLKQNI